jgi:large subunit ribosomal protein L9
MPMQLILTQDVNNLGKAGELVSVKSGFGRNYLVPRGMAVTASKQNMSELDAKRRRIASKVAKESKEATVLAERINGMTLQFERLFGEGDKMFGSVSAKDVVKQLEKAGIEGVEAHQIQLAEQVRAEGKYEAPVKLKAGVQATLKFRVVKQEKK